MRHFAPSLLVLLLALGGATLARTELAAPRVQGAGESLPDAGRGGDDHLPDQYRRSDFRSMRLSGPFPAEVIAVIDGDTFEARVTVWLGHEVRTRVRILGIDAPEMGSLCGEERAFAVQSRDALEQRLGRQVLLGDVRFDKYGGRVLARVKTRAVPDVAAAMLADGFALSYEGGRRQAWCDGPAAGLPLTSRR